MSFPKPSSACAPAFYALVFNSDHDYSTLLGLSRRRLERLWFSLQLGPQAPLRLPISSYFFAHCGVGVRGCVWRSRI